MKINSGVIVQSPGSIDESLNLRDLFLTAAPWVQQIIVMGPSEQW